MLGLVFARMHACMHQDDSGFLKSLQSALCNSEYEVELEQRPKKVQPEDTETIQIDEPDAKREMNIIVCGMDMTRNIAGTVPDGQAHMIFAVYVCVDTVLVTYNTVHNIVQPKQSVRQASRTKTKQGNEKAGRSGYAGNYIPFQGYHL